MLPLETLKTWMRTVEISVPEPRSLLLVDDEPENLDVLSVLLEDRYEVHTALCGNAALEIVHKKPTIDIVIADQRMPEMTGVELLARIAEEFPSSIRMVLTAYSDVAPMIDAINRGDVYRFLLKPFDPHEMRSVVKDALELKWTQTALHALYIALDKQNQTLRQTHRELIEAQQALVEAERLAAVGKVGSGIAHDIRNQVTIISLLMQLIESKTTSPSVLHAAKQAHDAMQSLLELLECVRTLGKPDGSGIGRQAIDPIRFVEETIARFKLDPFSHMSHTQSDSAIRLPT